MNRNTIDAKYKWDLTQIFKSTEEFEECYKKAENLIKDFKKYENIMGENAKKFYETINTYYEITRTLDKLYVYTNLLSDTDTSNNTYQSLKIKVSNLLDKWSKASFFVTPTILKKNEQEIEKYYIEEPKLKDYEIILKREFRYKEHTLSDEEEKLLSNLTKMLNNNYQTYELLKDSDLTFGTILDEAQKEVVLTESNYSIYIESKDRRVRKDAFQTLYKSYKQFSNSFASTLSGNINENITISKIKKYNSTIEWCLYHDELDETIYNNLINTVSNNMNILYKYYSLKKEILNLDELHLYDIYTPLIKNFEKKYSYEEAKETVLKALSILGEDYIGTLEKGLENNKLMLLKDINLFDTMYDKNLDYFKEISLYIIAGERKIEELKTKVLPELKKKAQESNDQIEIQKVNDMENQINRFEKKIYDLKTTRIISIQMAPQIRLLQNNDALLVEKIQSSITNTIPLWKNQIVLALGINNSKKALKGEQAVSKLTNEMLKKNSETLKQGSIDIAKEVEKSIVDIETLKKTNQDIIETLDTVIKIHEEGRIKRAEATKELENIEKELKDKLLEINVGNKKA